MLGLSVLLLLFGGLAIDYWRGLAVQRQLAAIADSAAIAAASGIDEDRYRTTGEVLLEPDRAAALASQSIEFQGELVSDAEVAVTAAGDAVTVTVEAELRLGLLGALIDDSSPLLVRASATAFPELRP
jgi:Flp pilus assembly protein TadG